MSDFLMELVMVAPGVIIALSIHEYAHARVAVSLGDFTPKMMGRVTLDPRAHIDPVGLLMLFLIHFGYAKPVMINPRNFKSPKRDDILVSLAGPGANLVLGFVFMFLLMLLGSQGIMSRGIMTVLYLAAVINVNFAIFNMIPLPPLDGSHILKQLLPPELAYKYAGIERYSMIIFLFIIVTPVLGYVLTPLSNLVMGFYRLILGLLF